MAEIIYPAVKGLEDIVREELRSCTTEEKLSYGQILRRWDTELAPEGDIVLAHLVIGGLGFEFIAVWLNRASGPAERMLFAIWIYPANLPGARVVPREATVEILGFPEFSAEGTIAAPWPAASGFAASGARCPIDLRVASKARERVQLRFRGHAVTADIAESWTGQDA